MPRRPLLLIVLALGLSSAAAAQQRPIFDPDDFVDPGQHDHPVFISRLVVGAARGYADDYRSIHNDAGFIHLTNTLYWNRLQFDYKHSEVRAENDPPPVRGCGCSPPVYFPTPPSSDSTPDAPPPAAKETVQLAWYMSVPRRSVGPPVVLRYRVTASRQPVDTTVVSGDRQESSRISGRERSYGFDGDTYFRIRGREVFGSILFGRTARSGTIDDRAQNELVYMNRFPAVLLPKQKILLRATLAVGGVSGRGATGLNVVNPAVEAFWREPRSGMNFHLIYSPQATRSGVEGWTTTHQIAFVVDRALYVYFFGPKNGTPAPAR